MNYFEQHGIEYVFYSAASAVALQQARQEVVDAAENGGQATARTNNDTSYHADSTSTSGSDESPGSDTESEGADASEEQATKDPRLKILSAAELEDVFVQRAPHLSGIKEISFLGHRLRDYRVCAALWESSTKACCGTCWLSQRWKIKYNKLSARREESWGLVYPREDQTFSNHSPVRLYHVLRLSWPSFPAVYNNESRSRLRWHPAHRPAQRVYWPNDLGRPTDTQGRA